MYSIEHALYLKKERRKRRKILFFQIFLVVFCLLLWQILSDTNTIDPFVFSSPKKVIFTIRDLFLHNHLMKHILITVYETLLSFFLATALGIGVATLLWWSPTLSKILDPYLTVLNGLPKVALGPIIIIWFGAGMQSIIVMALLISFIITIINIYKGFSEIDPNYILLLKSFGARKSQIFVQLILPGNIPTIISASTTSSDTTLLICLTLDFHSLSFVSTASNTSLSSPAFAILFSLCLINFSICFVFSSN